MAGRSDLLPLVKEGDNVLYDGLVSLGMNEEDIEFILINRDKLKQKSPKILVAKLKIGLEKATSVIDSLKDFPQIRSSTISEDEIAKIEECIRDNPDISETEDIALCCDVEESVVATYLQRIPLNEKQKVDIEEKVTTGNPINDIASILRLCPIKVQNYVESTFVTFSSEEGKRCLDVILTNFENYSAFQLRGLIVSRNLKLQDELGYVLRKRNDDDYSMLNAYFAKFEESESFFKIDTNFTKSDISLIQQSSLDDVDYLSVTLKKVASVIREFMEQYHPKTEIIEMHSGLQAMQIKQLFADYGEETLTFHSYRMIISNSLDEMIQKAKLKELRIPYKIFQHFLPFAFYYIKCSLPLENITHVVSGTSLTTHELFHLIYQLSDPVLRGFCIEHYSFSHPVPFYYPKLYTSSSLRTNIELEFCKELWYSLEQYHGLVSFGLGRAGWNPIGKSSLLDLIFETDFVRGNPQNSAFHFNSIDIQMTRNLFGGIKDTSTDESIRWAYLDCNRYSNNDLIKVICQLLDIAIVHVTYHDYKKNPKLLEQDIVNVTSNVKHLYILIRDYRGKEVKVEVGKHPYPLKNLIFIPNLDKADTNSNSVKKSLKELGYEILHLRTKAIGSDFLENIAKQLDVTCYEETMAEKNLILNITDCIRHSRKSSSKIDFSFLNYYPLFVDYMSCYHRAAYEMDQDKIDKLNNESKRLEKKLYSTEIGSVVKNFNKILNKERSTLVLWKLSQELSLLTRQVVATNKGVDGIVEQKNDRYNLEIIWREALLSSKFCHVEEKSREGYLGEFASNFGNYVERGEPFELIDGDNLRFLNQEIDELLSDMYNRQFLDLEKINSGQKIKMKQAPIVVSIFGPQSSGKSTLLNYCFGCKFLTSAGRCTRGIYASLAQLSRPVNLSNQFLILDTEGLDGIERTNFRDTSLIHFDRTMVLFCLAVSQVVIINVKGDIGKELQSLLEICAYSLNKLKVRKVATPKIFFVLNQQADPDPAKHLDSINLLLSNLNRESDLLDMEGAKISDLIQVLEENLFVLPSAFNSEQINKPSLKIFDSNVTKLSPTIQFADKCGDLLLAIIEQLDSMSLDDRTSFKTMSEWMEMSGTVWDTIIRYQDIVKYRNVEEIMCNNLLRKVVSELMDTNIYTHKQEYLEFTEKLFVEIQKIDIDRNSEILLTEFMIKFDNIFELHQESCISAFNCRCASDYLLKKMNFLCEESKSNLSRLIYMERKIYQDKIKFQIKAVLTKIKLRESRRRFQELIDQEVNNYLELGNEDKEEAFKALWIRCFGEDKEEEEIKFKDCFSSLYSIFKMESRTMEKESTIFQKFRDYNFQLKKVIRGIESDILNGFIKGAQVLGTKEQFIFPCNENNIPIKEMTPYPGQQSYSYLTKNSLYVVELERIHLSSRKKILINSRVPKECIPLVKYCSGYYNHPDIVWNDLDKKKQIILLSSFLRSLHNPSESTWRVLIKNISTNLQKFLINDPHVSPATVKEIIYYLCTVFTIVNYEIYFIQAKLTNIAERTISTLVFAYAFESFWKSKSDELENTIKTKNEMESLRQYFLQKIANRKMVLEGWDRNIMQESDSRMSRQFASHFLDGVVRPRILTAEISKIEDTFNLRKYELSHESIILSANELIQDEVNKNLVVTDEDNFVIQYVCNRNQKLKEIFFRKWANTREEIYRKCIEKIRHKFSNQIEQLKQILAFLLTDLSKPSDSKETQREEDFDSNCNFETADSTPWEVGSEAKMKESPCKAMVMYLRMYLDPSVTPEAFKAFFSDVFEVDGVNMKVTDKFLLSDKKPKKPILDGDTFKMLDDTMMFTSENIFNILFYLKQFLAVLNPYEFELPLEEFGKMLQPIKDKFETDATGCPNQCPSCGKLCERELHPNDGMCQIKTGHQICSMGGKVWNHDFYKTAVLFTCDDYKDHTSVVLEGSLTNWREFKIKYDQAWDWGPHMGEKYVALRENNREYMKNIWTLFGKGILEYYSKRGTTITYVPYTSIEDVYRSINTEYYICFVIDGTVSMATEIKKARISVGQFIDKYLERSNYSHYKVVIYRDHCDRSLIEMYPIGNKFTSLHRGVQGFLNSVVAFGGGDFPEAVLDGLATAVTVPDWKTTSDVRNIIIHIFDAPPHGDPPDYTSHDARSHKKHCCCCNHGTMCKFNWEADVWKNFQNYKIQYHGINTGNRIPKFESVMKEKLGVLCRDFQNVGDEMVNEAILQIFIQNTAD